MRKKINKIVAVLLLFSIILCGFIDSNIYANNNVDSNMDYDSMVEPKEEDDSAQSDQNDINIYNDENVNVVLKVISRWDEGCISEVVIENIGEKELSEWNLTFDTSNKISNCWNATMNEGEANYSFYAPKDYNKIIEPSNSISFGFNSNGNSELSNIVFSYVTLADNQNDSQDDNQKDKQNDKQDNSQNDNQSGKQNDKQDDSQNDNQSEKQNDKQDDSQNNKLNDRIKVEYNVTGSWTGGSSVVVRVYNISNEVIHNWALRYITNDQLYNVQCAEDISTESVHILKNAGWNQDIPVDSYVEFNYIQYYDKEIDIPDSFELLNVTEETNKNDYNVLLLEESRYGTSGIVQLIIENKTEEAIEDWSLEFSSNFIIDNVWNAELVSQKNNIKLTNPNYHQNISPLESYIIGMEVHGTEEKFEANSYKLTQEKNTHSDSTSGEKKEAYIGNVIFSNTSFETGKKTNVVINSKVINDDGCEVKVFKQTESGWKYITSLYDNGNMEQNHDDIMDDGTYSNQFSISSDKAQKISYKVGLYKNDIEIDSFIQEVEFYDLLSDNDIGNYYADIGTVLKYVNQYFMQNQYKYDEMDALLEYITDNCTFNLDINRICWYDGNTLSIQFTNGMDYCIEIIDSSDMANMSRGSGTTYDSEIENTYEFAITKSSRILYWAPFDTAWGDSDETEDLKAIMKDSDYEKRFTIFSDEKASIDSLKKLNKYGLIIFSTHGVNGEWLVSGELATANSLKKYKSEISASQISAVSIYDVACKKSNSYLALNSFWFTANTKNLPKSIVINNSCYSMNDNWSDAFLSIGAGAYFGNTGKITNEYASEACVNLVAELVVSGNMTGDSFDMTLDAYYDEGATFVGKGQGNLSLASGNTAIGFEDGIEEWEVKGDCRVLSKLGNVTPVEGDYMAMISTGVGYSMSGGAISKSLAIPADAEKMYLSWNFISAEFLEYISSQYDDPFKIVVSDGDTTKTIFQKSVNSVAKEMGATQTSPGQLICVSPEIVLNDYDDIWMSDWQNSSVDISDYAGKTVTLTFSADNAQDTAYPTAMLLDDIHFDSEEYESDMYVDIDSFTRGGKKTKDSKGKSYVIAIKDFKSQAKEMRKTIKAENGYKKLDQVSMLYVKTEEEFVNAWNSMKPGKGKSKIDTVAIMMHGKYYALIIDGENNENVVANDVGLATSDEDATTISSLEEKNIQTLHLYSCNAGLLDAIDCSIKKKVDGTKKKFIINHNVAMAFYKLGKIDEITAYDGSVAFTADKPRLSNDQASAFEAIIELQPSSNVDVKRYEGKVRECFEYLRRPIQNGPYLDESGICPNGEVKYDSSLKRAIYKYYHKKVEKKDLLKKIRK